MTKSSTEMTTLLHRLSDDFVFLFSDDRFTMSNSRVGYGFAWVELRSQGISLRFVAERGDSVALSIALGCRPEERFWIGIVRNEMSGESWLSDHANSESARFLRENLGDLVAIAEQEQQCVDFIGRLGSTAEKRADELLGPIEP